MAVPQLSRETLSIASALLTDHCNNYLYFAIIIELHIAIDGVEKRKPSLISLQVAQAWLECSSTELPCSEFLVYVIYMCVYVYMCVFMYMCACVNI